MNVLTDPVVSVSESERLSLPAPLAAMKLWRTIVNGSGSATERPDSSESGASKPVVIKLRGCQSGHSLVPLSTPVP